MQNSRKIVMNHGAGGRQMQDLIQKIIVKRLNNHLVARMDDATILTPPPGKRLAMTTDSFVVSPLFFSGGDIGRLAVAGTVNDLLTCGARPQALSLALILEEGFALSDLERIIDSIAIACHEAHVSVVTGDTKVVEKGKGDQLYINTCGIGYLDSDTHISSYNAKAGDKVYITGAIGVHEVALMKARNLLPFEVEIESDAAPLVVPMMPLLEDKVEIHVVKDPTRGGVAQALYEITSHSQCTIKLFEALLPITKAVKGVCELAGFDPLYLSNEGKFVIIAPEKSFLSISRSFPDAKLIGEVIHQNSPELLLETLSGGVRRVGQLETMQLPRIC